MSSKTEYRDIDPTARDLLAQTIAQHIGHKLALTMIRQSRTCLFCEHWRGSTETCGLTNPPLRPPADVIVFGCDKHEFIGKL